MGDCIARTQRTGATGRFLRDEGGVVTVFSLFILMMMLIVGGLALDSMRHEMTRAQLQTTLDRAVLAGAKSATPEEARATVEDYFAKADLSSYLAGEQEGDIEIYLNSASVTARASRTIDTHLMRLAGVETLTAGGISTAEVRVPKLEISLVLDVSGSMGGTKISRLRGAAKQFVSTILDTSEPGNAVISVIPFSWSVTPPKSVFDALAVDVRHDNSTCLRFNANDFHHATLTSGKSAFSSGKPVDQMIYTSLYGDFDNLQSTSRSCFTDDYMKFLPYSMNEGTLHAKIDSLQASGNTSGHEGMNWGAALLDPSFRQVSVQLIAKGEMDAALAHVPADYTEPETLKVVVMMGDGANTTSYFFDRSPPKYRGKHSNLYRVTQQGQRFDHAFDRTNPSRQWHEQWVEQYCYLDWLECVYEDDGPVTSSYYLRDPSPHRYYDIDRDDWLSRNEFEDLENRDGFVSKERLDWEEAWGHMSPRYYSEITGDWSAWNDYVGSERLDGNDKDARMRDVCGATKTHGVVVYSIGFEVSKGGRAERVLSDCASSTSHYYRANTTDISAVFNSIAANVQNLRLTQ
ncbi:pilus assembly protein TadG-related protein [Roseovarius ramblicola]|uniref:Pilus assembly protein TadG-related protein n=1 Tax=Roseovarius ramblicola TaxID=2022336 RepID=A0ABV5HYY6_9RHOB